MLRFKISLTLILRVCLQVSMFIPTSGDFASIQAGASNYGTALLSPFRAVPSLLQGITPICDLTLTVKHSNIWWLNYFGEVANKKTNMSIPILPAQCHLAMTRSPTTSNWVNSDILGSRRKGLLPFSKSSGVLVSQAPQLKVVAEWLIHSCTINSELQNVKQDFLPQGQVHPYCNQDSSSLVIDSPLFPRVREWNWPLFVSLLTRAAF